MSAVAPGRSQQSPHQRALEVGHIIPKNHCSFDAITNVQALCFRCNACKRDTDCTKFLGIQEGYRHREDDCIFCALEGSGRVLLEIDPAAGALIADAHPVTEDQNLVIPRRFVADGMEPLRQRREILSAQVAMIRSWTVVRSSGEAEG